MSKVNIPVLDNSNDQSTVSAYIKDSGTDAQITAFYNAVDGMTLGTLVKSYVTQSVDKDAGSNTPPANKFARRENRFVCYYTDTVTQKSHSFSIPCADLDLTVGDNVDISAGAGATLKSTFETLCASELGNTVTLNAIEYRGASYG
jgi:hypothetical protein